jgi:phosphoserine phosphatase
MELTHELPIDIAFQRESIHTRSRRLVAFDMDSTLIQGEVIDELAKLAGVGEQVAAITAAAMRGELDFKQSFAKRVSLLKGLPETKVNELVNRIQLTGGAERLITTLKNLGYKTAILSGGFNFVGRYLQERLGLDYLHANELDIAGGTVTGNVIEPIVDGARKAACLQEIAAKEGISLDQCIAVGDGANDLPMLNIAGLGIAFHAKPVVRQTAKHAISNLGLDGILYLVGVRDRETEK